MVSISRGQGWGEHQKEGAGMVRLGHPRRAYLVLEHHADLEQAERARCGLEVAKVHLGGGERDMIGAGAIGGDGSERRELHWVAKLGTGAVHLDGGLPSGDRTCASAITGSSSSNSSLV
jgi:hypothetical protein